MLRDRGYPFSTFFQVDDLTQLPTSSSVQRDHIPRMKEEHCYVALNYAAELQQATDSINSTINYEMFVVVVCPIRVNPRRDDESTIPLGHERFTAPEILFQPSLIERQERGLHQIIFDT